MSQHPDRTDQQQIWNSSKFLEVTIDRPAKVVWPYLFRKNNDVWSRTAYTTVAGHSGQVGEIYEMPFEGGFLAFEAITVTPDRHLVLKITFRNPDDERRNLCGYDFFTLKEHEGGTTLAFQQAVQLTVDKTENLVERTEKHSRFLSEIFEDLKRMVEGAVLPTTPQDNWWRK
jgi:hypothetical protein